MATSLSACGGLSDFPDWHPYATIFSQGKSFKCSLVDKENLTFNCDKESIPSSNLVDGSFCTTPDETKQIINWAKESKEKFKQNCQGN